MYYITYNSETVVYDRHGEKLVACPNDSEAYEYIQDHLTDD